MSNAMACDSETASQVFLFQEGFKRFGASREVLRETLGGKGAGLAEMASIGVRVPPGMTITTDACRRYYEAGETLEPALLNEVTQKLAHIEKILGRSLGDRSNPLLLSVRSGAKFSMPGMMDTILNLGLNATTVTALAEQTENPRFAWDSYRRFIQMYSTVVFDLDKRSFENILETFKDRKGYRADTELTVDDLRSLVDAYHAHLRSSKNISFPEDVTAQLAGAIEAVFRSWNNDRAIYYRNLNRIDHALGTAVTIQAMVFGNFDDRSATGVCFTRNPSSGEPGLFGEYLVNAQGEDVVAGVRTPRKIAEMKRDFPAVYDELLRTTSQLERHYKEMQDIEFTVERGELYLLQTRTGKRTAAAAIKIAVDLVREGMLSKDQALMRVEPMQLNQLLLPCFEPEEKERARKDGRLVARGLNASPGAATGEIVFSPDESEELARRGRKVILARVETCPDDIHGMVPAQGVITSRGGMTSHAAVVARGMGKPCVAGCEAIRIDEQRGEARVGDRTIKKGEIVSLDGATGEIFLGAIATRESLLSDELGMLLRWADEGKRMAVRANADNPADATRARGFGAVGIGLCRTEHMFMEHNRLPVMQRMIMASSPQERHAALAELLPMQREDFIGIFRAMEGLPVTIRLLDPPLHEFLPKHEEIVAEIAVMQASGKRSDSLREKERLLAKIRDLHEANPMMGLRGCRLGLVFPEINEMQVRAIIEAAITVTNEGKSVLPEIMIPLIGHVNELQVVRAQLEEVARACMKEHGVSIAYKFGTMIEIPRACVTADEIAQHAEFFSFGTNDLTQMTFGYSRDDAESKFLNRYLEGVSRGEGSVKILSENPFEVLDRKGVGALMQIAVGKGRATRTGLKIGVCGEHGGDPSSIAFADQLGLDYVSCSPFRVPIARLAAAQATIARRGGQELKDR